MSSDPPRPPAPGPEPNHQNAGLDRRLRALRPGEPDPTARDRIWRRVSARLDEEEPAAVAARLRALSPAGPSPAASERVWSRLQTELRADPSRARTPAAGRPRLAPAWVAAALALIVALTTVNTAAYAALPGNVLYPVKRGWEVIHWSLTLAPQVRADLALTLADRRRAEAESLVAQGRAPALVALALDSARDHLAFAAPYQPALVAARVDTWQAAVAGWPAAYQAPGLAALADWPTSGLPPAGTLTPVPTLGLTQPVLTLTPPAATLLPPTLDPGATAAAPTLTPASAATPTPGLLPPTLGPPTLPLPTLGAPTLGPPTLAPPTLPPATITLPAAIGPTPTGTSLPVLPTLSATVPAFLASPTSTSPSAATPTPGLPLPTLGPPTLGPPTLPLPTLVLP